MTMDLVPEKGHAKEAMDHVQDSRCTDDGWIIAFTPVLFRSAGPYCPARFGLAMVKF